MDKNEVIIKLKHVFPLEFNYLIRRFNQFISQKIPDFEKEALNAKKRVFFLDTPAYANLGDQAIAYAMKKYMKDNFPEYEQFEIQEDIYPHYIKWLSHVIREDDLVCLTGGGNMGILYQSYEATRRDILKRFKNNTIVVFPQTLDYGYSLYGKKEFKRSIKIYNSCKCLVLAGRDINSYNKMKEVYTSAKVVYSPDIVLTLNYTNLFSDERDGVGICIRDDEESVMKKDTVDIIKNNYTSSKILSTIDNSGKRLVGKRREESIYKVLKEFSTCKIIFTDRLHGTIFSYITNTPCISFPNSNGKVKRVSELLEKYGKVKYLERYNQNIDFNEYIIDEKNNQLLICEFDDFKNAIKSSIVQNI